MRSRATLAAGLAATAALAVVPAFSDAERATERTTARNVIVLQGDGMATAQRDLIRLVTVGNKQGQDLAMNKLDHAGLVHTDPADPKQAVTDSAAAATAFATGVKTFNGAIGVDANGKAVRTLLEDARRAGKATGLVTTSQVTDATPAAYAAHVSDRAQQSEIARQYPRALQARRDPRRRRGLLVPEGHPGRAARQPADRPDRGEQGRQGQPRREGQAARLPLRLRPAPGCARRAGRKLLGLFANEEMFEHREEGHGDLYEPAVPLTEMAAKALDILAKDRDGFFVLIEEEAIDEMAHENNAGLMIKSGAALDATVKLAVDFARSHPGTLIVVQGDHETGGLTIENPDTEDESGEELSTRGRPVHGQGHEPAGVRGLDDRRPHRRRHADHAPAGRARRRSAA